MKTKNRNTRIHWVGCLDTNRHDRQRAAAVVETLSAQKCTDRV